MRLIFFLAEYPQEMVIAPPFGEHSITLVFGVFPIGW